MSRRTHFKTFGSYVLNQSRRPTQQTEKELSSGFNEETDPTRLGLPQELIGAWWGPLMDTFTAANYRVEGFRWAVKQLSELRDLDQLLVLSPDPNSLLLRVAINYHFLWAMSDIRKEAGIALKKTGRDQICPEKISEDTWKAAGQYFIGLPQTGPELILFSRFYPNSVELAGNLAEVMNTLVGDLPIRATVENLIKNQIRPEEIIRSGENHTIKFPLKKDLEAIIHTIVNNVTQWKSALGKSVARRDDDKAVTLINLLNQGNREGVSPDLTVHLLAVNQLAEAIRLYRSLAKETILELTTLRQNIEKWTELNTWGTNVRFLPKIPSVIPSDYSKGLEIDLRKLAGCLNQTGSGFETAVTIAGLATDASISKIDFSDTSPLRFNITVEVDSRQFTVFVNSKTGKFDWNLINDPTDQSARAFFSCIGHTLPVVLQQVYDIIRQAKGEEKQLLVDTVNEKTCDQVRYELRIPEPLQDTGKRRSDKSKKHPSVALSEQTYETKRTRSIDRWPSLQTPTPEDQIFAGVKNRSKVLILVDCLANKSGTIEPISGHKGWWRFAPSVHIDERIILEKRVVGGKAILIPIAAGTHDWLAKKGYYSG